MPRCRPMLMSAQMDLANIAMNATSHCPVAEEDEHPCHVDDTSNTTPAKSRARDSAVSLKLLYSCLKLVS